MFDDWRGFKSESLPSDWKDKLRELGRVARGDILKMTTVASSGHPGGSMSSLELYLVLYHFANVDPKQPGRNDRDRIIVSHGHTSPGVYAALAHTGFFDIKPVLHGFRQADSPFEGHVELSVPGVEWDTGNLGQGLAVGVGKAIYAKLSGQDFHTYVLMGDGEQQKGQIAESRRHAVTFGLNNLTAVIDRNQLQICGKTADVHPQNIAAGWEADGWRVIEIDGHDLDEVYDACRTARMDTSTPVVILANTVMGKGVSFMEHDHNYHGAPVKPDRLSDALRELDLNSDYEELLTLRAGGPPPPFTPNHSEYPDIDTGEPITYEPGKKLDNRSAWGNALLSVAEANLGKRDVAMGVFDCDLAGSVKTAAFAGQFPDNFFQCGIAEHATAVTAGALSSENAVSVFAAFGIFGVSESYNQERLNDINHSNVKLFCTHSGINVGEDGKTHQCIDFFGLLNSTFGWKVITPADPNQTDRIARYVLSQPGCFAVMMGRAKMEPVLDEKGEPFFGGDYTYEYGRMDAIRAGEQVALVSAGNILPYALDGWNILAEKGVNPALFCVSDWSDLHPDDLARLASFEHIVTVEDHNVKTGLGTTLAASMLEAGHAVKFTRLGVRQYGSSGPPADLYKILGLDGESIAEVVSKVCDSVTVSA
ncbi:transketolase [candidate division GN15 bacterium]|nr:transketolase [candidate division GN15 bacterium]